MPFPNAAPSDRVRASKRRDGINLAVPVTLPAASHRTRAALRRLLCIPYTRSARSKSKLRPFYSLVASITAEELGHVELVSSPLA
jgi:Manganese containing catalase